MDELDEAIELVQAELATVRETMDARVRVLTEQLMAARALLAASEDRAKQLAEELKDLRAREAELTPSPR